MNNVQDIIEKNVCLHCGICAAACPNSCIDIGEKSSTNIDLSKCNNCGLCKRYCPGNSSNCDIGRTVSERMQGKALESYVGRTLDSKILMNAVSGGCATTLINTLLNLKRYDVAIGVKSIYFGEEIKMEIYDIDGIEEAYQKSVYIMPSYREVIKYIKKNNDKKVILIGSGCIISSLKKFLKDNKCDEQNYLFVGLLCDCTLNPNVEKYFKNYIGRKGQFAKGFDFRSKKAGAFWPGHVQLYFKDKTLVIPREERYKIVKYFKNERCLYCLDHMNLNADIVFGDNYTGFHSDKFGTNSIIVRSEKGRAALDEIRYMLKLYKISYKKILDSQGIEKKEINYFYSQFFCQKSKININEGIFDSIIPDAKENKLYRKAVKNINKGITYRRVPKMIEIYLVLRGDSSLINRIAAFSKINDMEM